MTTGFAGRSRGIGKQHPLAELLIAQGFSSREARRVLNALFDGIKDALQRHETVELPFGTFKVIPNVVKPYRRWWRGRPVTFYQHRYRVEFTPHDGG